MVVQENINDQIALKIAEAWNTNNLAGIAELVSADFQVEGLGGAAPLNIQQYIAYSQTFLSACPGGKMESTVVVSQGEYVVTHWKFTGVHTAPLHLSAKTVIPPTGKLAVGVGSSTFRIRNGKLVHMWSFWDSASVLRQLGVLPLE
jgi:predicted ester cyclase